MLLLPKVPPLDVSIPAFLQLPVELRALQMRRQRPGRIDSGQLKVEIGLGEEEALCRGHVLLRRHGTQRPQLQHNNTNGRGTG